VGVEADAGAELGVLDRRDIHPHPATAQRLRDGGIVHAQQRISGVEEDGPERARGAMRGGRCHMRSRGFIIITGR
jgi:hypothetical protein